MNEILKTFEGLPLVVKVILLVFFGGVISPVYRILRFVDTKSVKTLVIGVICLVTGCGNAILAIVDIVSEVTRGKVEILLD